MRVGSSTDQLSIELSMRRGHAAAMLLELFEAYLSVRRVGHAGVTVVDDVLGRSSASRFVNVAGGGAMEKD